MKIREEAAAPADIAAKEKVLKVKIRDLYSLK
ncbi:MAG: hypothetical protein ACJARP_000608 [Vicingaceae bacterium]|jgi:hypothetical protein